jgi:hypothetical protein
LLGLLLELLGLLGMPQLLSLLLGLLSLLLELLLGLLGPLGLPQLPCLVQTLGRSPQLLQRECSFLLLPPFRCKTVSCRYIRRALGVLFRWQ